MNKGNRLSESLSLVKNIPMRVACAIDIINEHRMAPLSFNIGPMADKLRGLVYYV